MARARSLKPGFFFNELLAELPPLGRLLFAGLWCSADRSGRLEDRPKRLKAEILPYDECDVDALLQALHDRGFVVRYSVDGQRLIQVTNFARHQSPHHQERPSRLPAPALLEASGERVRGRPTASPVFVPDKSEASPGFIPDKSGSYPVVIALTPDSFYLTPDSKEKDMSDKSDPAPQPEAEHASTKAECEAILEHLNAKAGKRFRPVEANIRLLAARLKEATGAEIRAVIDDRVSAWKGDAKMATYLRPETLFNATKFAGYLGQLGTGGAEASPWEGAV